MKDYHLILASKSPRRQELLENIVSNFTIRLKEIEEVYPEDLPVKEVPEYLARLKAEAFKADMKANEIILASDTIVTLDNKIYGKPKDRQDAIRILQELSGKVHEVITGVFLMSISKEFSFKEITKVHFKTLSLEEIEYYIDTFEPYDKAGAYAIQEWIGMIGIKKIEGDYFNVVGLPLFELNEALKKF
jgi:septum formation protein